MGKMSVGILDLARAWQLWWVDLHWHIAHGSGLDTHYTRAALHWTLHGTLYGWPT